MQEPAVKDKKLSPADVARKVRAALKAKADPAIPRTTLRYAIERFPEEKRKALLRDTRQK